MRAASASPEKTKCAMDRASSLSVFVFLMRVRNFPRVWIGFSTTAS